MARKTSLTETRIWTFSCRAPTAGGDVLHEVLFLANRYRNGLVQIERDRLEEYRRVRSALAPALDAAETSFANVEKEIEDVYKDLGRVKSEVYEETGIPSRSVPSEIKVKIASLKERRKEIGAQMKRERQRFEGDLSAARDELKRRTKEKTVDVRGPVQRGMIRDAIVEEMLGENWPTEWKALQEIDCKAALAKKSLRAARPFGSGTGGLVEAAVEQAIKKAREEKTVPQYRAFRGEGRVGGQLFHCSTADLFAGTNATLRLVPAPPKPGGKVGRHSREFFILKMSVKLRGKLEQIELPVRLHREMSKDAAVKYAWVGVYRVGRQFRYEIQLTLESAEFSKPKRPSGEGRVAINPGWRQVPGGLLAGTWVSDTGRCGTIVVPDRLVERQRLTRDLRAFAQGHFDEMKAVLAKFTRLLGHEIRWDRICNDRARNALERWVRAYGNEMFGRERIMALVKAFEAERLAAGKDRFASFLFVCRWAHAHGEASARLALWLEMWARKERHLRQYEAFLAARVLAQRNAFYKSEAIRLSTEFGTLIVDDTKYNELAKRSLPGEEDPQHKRAREQRQFVAPGALREVLVGTFGAARTRSVSAKWNTERCVHCQKNLQYGAGDDTGVCKDHGVLVLDQNNCLNMLRRERSGGDDLPGGARKEEIATENARLVDEPDGERDENEPTASAAE